MKKGKLIIIGLLILLLFTGCDAVVDIEIVDGVVNQKFNVTMNESEITEENAFYTFSQIVLMTEFDTEMLSNYSITNYSKIGEKSFNASRKFYVNDYKNDNILDICFDDYSYSYKNDIFKIETKGNFKCYDNYEMLDKITLNITTKYDVINNNADRAFNNKYTWNFTKDDHDKNILIEVSCKEDENDKPDDPNPNPIPDNDPNDNKKNDSIFDSIFDSESGFNTLTVVLILLLVLLFGFVIFLVLQVKNRRNNRL